MDEITTKINISIIMLTLLLMNTFLYCGAGELLTEQVGGPIKL